jgi:hypothetical protein
MKKSTFSEVLEFLHSHIKRINDSKIFAGIMIITLNIVSRFVNIKLSKSVESYLKYTFSKYLLVFTIAWMGTRDIYIAFTIMTIYLIIMDYLLDDDSMFCILPEEFKDYHQSLLETDGENEQITDEDIKKAEKILEKAKQQNKTTSVESYSLK